MRRRSRAIKARHTRSRAIKARHTRSRAIKARHTRSRAIKARLTRSRAIKARLTRSRAIKARLTRRPRERRESAARRTSHTPAPSASLWALPSDRDASVAACRAPPSHRQGTGRGNAGWSVSRVRQCAGWSVSRVRQCAAEPSQGTGGGNASVGWTQVSGGTQRPFESTGANQRQLLSTIDGSTG
jgi:hypothetical protein